MKVVIIGANGQLGSELCKVLSGHEIVAITHADLEITNQRRLKDILGRALPHVVVNTAAYVRVDDCESDRDRAYLVNALGARNVAVAARATGAKVVHISTDHVFGGEMGHRHTPYTEFDTACPVNVYGQSKLAGENFVQNLCPEHFIIRTSGLFGAAGSSGKGGNFIETVLRLAGEQDEIRVVNDQVFSPTYARDLARKIVQLIDTEYYGLFHITNQGACSWYDFAREIMHLAGLATAVVPITSDQYPQKAKRPGFSVLDNYRLRLLGTDDMRSWQEALQDYMKATGRLG